MINVSIYEKLAAGAKALKAAVAIDNTCKVIAWNMTYKELRALDKANRHIKSDMVVLKCRMERNDTKMTELRDYLN
nr:MAG TPA: hypothetical protein [Bacteriophage sp.]